MNLLALDTASPAAAVGLARADGAVFAAPPDAARRHARGLVPAIRDLLAAAGLRPADLGAIAVGLGPGSFTGTRIGVAAAKALAYALAIPLVGFDSLEALAQDAPIEALQVSAIADAQRGELFVADFARASAAAPLLRTGATRIEPASSWLASLPPGRFVLGPGLERIRAALPPSALAAGPDADLPDLRRLLAFARLLLDAGHRSDPWFLEPIYLRRAAAEEKLG